MKKRFRIVLLAVVVTFVAVGTMNSQAVSAVAPKSGVTISSSLVPDGSYGFKQGPRTLTSRSSPRIMGSRTISFGPAVPGAGLTINIQYDDASLTQYMNPADIQPMKDAVAYVVQQFRSKFSDPMNLNITIAASNVGLGSSGGVIGGANYTYGQIRAALVTDAKSTDDAATLAGSLPLIDPITVNHQYFVPNSEAKAMGLIPDNAAISDGTFTFNGTTAFTFDPNNRAVANKVDFIGVAYHEFTEIMGRNQAALGQWMIGANFVYCPMDLFHFAGPGVRDVDRNDPRSFSIDNGVTLLKAFNTVPNADPQDWASGTNDAFNAFSSSGVQNDMTALDLRVMDVLGFDPQITTAAEISVSGRVVTAAGTGIRNARVTLTDSRGHIFTAVSNAFGYYSLPSVPSGDTYVAQAAARGYIFGPRVIALNDSLTDLRFAAR